MKKLAIFLYYVIFLGSLQAQSVFSFEQIGLKSDSLPKQLVEYFDPGERGTDLLWDFSGQLRSNVVQPVVYHSDSLGRISAIGKGLLCRYRLKTDTLFLIESESPLKKIHYFTPIIQMKYPLAYGDSISSPFEGLGLYCGDHLYKEKGIQSLNADASGAIILSEKDTLKNVLRVYSLKSYSLCMDMNPEALDTARLKQVIEERYEWYARGCRYPVFETVTSTSYANMELIGTTQAAYCYLPGHQNLLCDSINRDIRAQDSLERAQTEKLQESIIHYHVSVDGSNVVVRYSLDADARITALISNPMGIIYKRREWNGQTGEGHTTKIDCSGLRRGTYILYLNVNGKIHSQTITL